MGVKGIRLSNNLRGARQDSQNKDVIDCVVEGSESPKQETTKWQPGSAQAQFGVRGSYKNLLKNFYGCPLTIIPGGDAIIKPKHLSFLIGGTGKN
ncbi:hypothetical protein [Nostoc sp.]|uniref:hypothetical protein n=1 Tax=Nostoc sp. TaxID=1180 RepID=UPI002FF5BAB5